MSKILLTGYSGFIGSYLLKELLKLSYDVVCLGRTHVSTCQHQFTEISRESGLSPVLVTIDTIIHCAARVHVMKDESTSPLDDYREVNTAGTLNLARQAIEAGVKRFIFISSVKVNGESTEIGKPFTNESPRNPQDFYGQSKSEAEEQLLQLAEETGLEVVIIRPTLVYGPNVKANFASLMNLVSKGLPLPFGCISNNKRSLVSITNLVDLIIKCIEHSKAANQVFLVSDDNDVSTASMVKHMSTALGKPNRMLPIPLWLYHVMGKIFGKQDVVNRLLGSLQVDITHTKETLDWTPPQTLEEGFKQTAETLSKYKDKSSKKMIRTLDFLAAFFSLFLIWPLLLVVTIIGLFDTGSPIFCQTRVGRNQKPFKLIKFRTMSVDTKSVASHLASNTSITKLGNFLRKTKIDELPQLINVLKGEMSLVGPRPNLFNQEELIKERNALGVYDVLPGITGLAQVQNIDMSTAKLLAKTDKQMIENLTIKDYFKYILMTVTGSGSGDAVK